MILLKEDKLNELYEEFEKSEEENWEIYVAKAQLKKVAEWLKRNSTETIINGTEARAMPNGAYLSLLKECEE